MLSDTVENEYKDEKSKVEPIHHNDENVERQSFHHSDENIERPHFHHSNENVEKTEPIDRQTISLKEHLSPVKPIEKPQYTYNEQLIERSGDIILVYNDEQELFIFYDTMNTLLGTLNFKQLIRYIGTTINDKNVPNNKPPIITKPISW